jgi:betaine-aldehyde dehydrogenase
VREPLGVLAKILPFNHPFMFSAGKIAAPLAAGNSVIVKPPEQAPLSTLRFTELIDGLLPPGVFNVATGGREAGQALTAHGDVAMLSVIGSIATGRAVMHAAANGIRPVLLELGDKNALIAFADADPFAVADAMIAGMNFAWCGQSCGSTSRAFIHAGINDAVLEHLGTGCTAIRPGLPTEAETKMGAIGSRSQFERILAMIETGRKDGARLLAGGGRPTDPKLANGFFIDPTVFVDVTPEMRIAREEIFGPVLSVLRWDDEAAMVRAVNAPPFHWLWARYWAADPVSTRWFGHTGTRTTGISLPPRRATPLKIHADILSHPDDMKAAMACIELCREIGNSTVSSRSMESTRFVLLMGLSCRA